jgi:hypothetical protein
MSSARAQQFLIFAQTGSPITWPDLCHRPAIAESRPTGGRGRRESGMTFQSSLLVSSVATVRLVDRVGIGTGQYVGSLFAWPGVLRFARA